MRQTPGDIASQLQELASRSLRQNVRNNQRFAELLKRISGGQLSMQQVRDELRQFTEQETAEYVRTLTTMGINFFSGLLELNQGYNERFFQRLGDAHEPPEATLPRSDGELVLSGKLGEVAQGRFVVENRRDQISEVAIAVSPVAGRNGSFRAPFVIEPAAFRLGAGEERPVLLGVRLHPELFRSGEEYLCQLTVRGPQDMLLDVRIQILDEAVKTEFVADVITVEVEEDLGTQETRATSTSVAAPAPNKASASRPVAARRKQTAKKSATKKSSVARKRARKRKPSS